MIGRPAPGPPAPSTQVPHEPGGQPLRTCCQLVLAALGEQHGPALPAITEPAMGTAPTESRACLERLAHAAQLRVRRVMLSDSFWRTDCGPFIAYRAADNRPVAMISGSSGGYRLHDPRTGQSEPVTAGVALTLEPFADVLYPRLPARPLRHWEVVRFGLWGTGRDLVTLLLLGALSGLLAIVSPLLTAVVFDRVIPGARWGELWSVVLALGLSSLVLSLFGITRAIATLRLAGRASARLQAALWDRLLGLPPRFFRDYTTGDLALRTGGIEDIVRSLSDGSLNVLLTGLFSAFSASLMFAYDRRLGRMGLILVLVALVVQSRSGLRQLRIAAQVLAHSGPIASLVLDLIRGIAKLRTAGAERRAFAGWAAKTLALRELTLQTHAPLQVFYATYPLLSLLLLYALAALAPARPLSAGRFLGFLAAFQGLLGAALAAGQAAVSVAALVPTYRRLQPILDSAPEAEPHRADPGPLDGEIELSHVSFRYSADSPWIIEDLSLRIRPGEFVAITGPSGSGKSTVIRLLLGFERPTQGAIYYGGQDLGELDLRAVRQQLGVVLQDGKLLTGDILTNIRGSSNRTRAEALHAAELAGFGRDLEQLPMGIHTLVSEEGSTLSGGQRQRLLIARALLRQPRILFLDEATSSLDNQTQATIARSIEGLAATRVVIAHRLSTIRNADRILVLVGGRLVQSGTYAELMSTGGPFVELVTRQIEEAASLGSGP